jgi:hypothetical protein
MAGPLDRGHEPPRGRVGGGAGDDPLAHAAGGTMDDETERIG